jgi:type IV pilus assembly protein PilV
VVRQAACSACRQRGVGLIEVLVAVLVLAVGLLGVAALQAIALRNSQSSLERTQAVVLSYAILDAMRANPMEARAGGYDMGMSCQAPTLSPTVQPAEVMLGRNDRNVWLGLIKAELGGSACGAIACVAAAGTEARDCRVTVRWDDTRGTGGSGHHEMTTVVRL